MGKKAFTLIELIIVVTIIGVLATIVVPRITNSTKDAKYAKCDKHVQLLNQALELRAAENDGDYPADQTEFDSEILNNTTYFPHGAPECPFGSAYIYNTTKKTVNAHNHGGGSVK